MSKKDSPTDSPEILDLLTPGEVNGRLFSGEDMAISNSLTNVCSSIRRMEPTGAAAGGGEGRGGEGEGSRHSSSSSSGDAKDDLLYGVEDTPPWYLCVLLGLQHSMTCFGANLTVALVVTPAMCVVDYRSVSEILSTIFFMAGIVTFLQSTFGTRLPIVQGATFAFLVPTFAILNLPQWKCPSVTDVDESDESYNATTVYITSTEDMSSRQTEPDNATTLSNILDRDIWKSRMREVQGAIILASLFEILLGVSGLIGVLLRYIGPLSIAPTISLVGLSLFPAASDFASKNWYIALTTSVLIIVFSQYMRNVKVPCFVPNGKRSFSLMRFPLFSLFPVIMAIIASWILCMILTVTNAIPNDKRHWSYSARTDVKIRVLDEASWFRFPYPCQWGIPTFSVGAVFGMVAGVMAGAIESIGDYFACARLAGAPPPPIHAVNRGIFVEGLGCVLAGLWGSGSGATSYSENVGAIGITKVGSRRVVQVEALLMIVFGVLGKVGAFFVTIPDPVIGGVFLVMFGIITAVGVSNLQFVDLNSTRNLCIFGFSLFFGLALPSWLSADENKTKLSTGSVIADQIICVLLSTSMFVGGMVGFFLDNTIPGTEKERGLSEWRAHLRNGSGSVDAPSGGRGGGAGGGAGEGGGGGGRGRGPGLQCYDLPFGMTWIRRFAVFKYIPLSPTFLLDAQSEEEADDGGRDGFRPRTRSVAFQRRASVALSI